MHYLLFCISLYLLALFLRTKYKGIVTYAKHTKKHSFTSQYINLHGKISGKNTQYHTECTMPCSAFQRARASRAFRSASASYGTNMVDMTLLYLARSKYGK